jgi:hypothetical protein
MLTIITRIIFFRLIEMSGGLARIQFEREGIEKKGELLNIE